METATAKRLLARQARAKSVEEPAYVFDQGWQVQLPSTLTCSLPSLCLSLTSSPPFTLPWGLGGLQVGEVAAAVFKFLPTWLTSFGD